MDDFLFQTNKAHCDEKPGSFCIINRMFDIFSKKYLTTNNPYRKRIQNFFKIRILYSPDPEFRENFLPIFFLFIIEHFYEIIFFKK